MSIDVLGEILGLLQNCANISVQVFLKPGKKGTRLTTISIKESTGIQSIQKSSRKPSKIPEEKKKAKKTPSRLLRDGKRREAFLSRKAEPCEGDPSSPADPAPSTTQRKDRMDPRRIFTPSHRLHLSVGAGQEEEWRTWRPAPGERVEDFIPQLDGLNGEGADLEKEREKEERNHEDETDVGIEKVEEEKEKSVLSYEKEEKDDEDSRDEKDEDNSGDMFCIHEVKINTFSFRPEENNCKQKLNFLDQSSSYKCDACGQNQEVSFQGFDVDSFACVKCPYKICSNCYY